VSIMTATTLPIEPAVVAREVLAGLERAWNTADGPTFGAMYAQDASFVTIRGEHHTGSAAIGAGHAAIFSTIYAGSINRMELIRAEQVGDGLVLAISRSTLDCPSGPLTGRHQAMSTSLITRQGGSWLVRSTHNTLMAG
jgi:uncharacterized protein (TIGR02246 family)